jgi:hypothetical protein
MTIETLNQAVEMTRPWQSQNDFHIRLEISYRPRDFHIPTSPFIFWRRTNPKAKSKTTDARLLVTAGHQTAD